MTSTDAITAALFSNAVAAKRVAHGRVNQLFNDSATRATKAAMRTAIRAYAADAGLTYGEAYDLVAVAV